MRFDHILSTQPHASAREPRSGTDCKIRHVYRLCFMIPKTSRKSASGRCLLRDCVKRAAVFTFFSELLTADLVWRTWCKKKALIVCTVHKNADQPRSLIIKSPQEKNQFYPTRCILNYFRQKPPIPKLWGPTRSLICSNDKINLN